METNTIKWTDKRIITGKTLFVIPPALVFANVVFVLGYSILHALIPALSLNSPAKWLIDAVSLLAGVFFGTKLLKCFYNWRLSRMDEDTAAEYLARESKFKWHILFTLGIGTLTVLAVLKLWGMILEYMTENATSVAAFVGAALLLVLAVVLVVIGCRKLHRHMVQVTRTNAELIDEVYFGMHDSKIPNGVTRSDIISVLYRAAAYSVTTAAIVYAISAAVNKLGKLLMKALGISALIGVILGLAGAKAAEQWASDLSQGTKEALDAAEQADKEYAAHVDATDEAKKKAQFSYRQAVKAHNYNPNSYDAYRKKNLAKKDYWNYQEIKKGK